MKFEKPILMGHSMGAATVMRIGAQYPDLARAIIMLDPASASRVDGDQRPRRQQQPQDAEHSLRQAHWLWRGHRRHWLRRIIAASRTWWRNAIRIRRNGTSSTASIGRSRKSSITGRIHHGWARRGAGRERQELLSKIAAPVLILKADAPPEIRKSNEEAAKVIQHGKLVHVDGAAHNLHHDQRKRTVDELDTFLKTL